jgi:hypothetical protein
MRHHSSTKGTTAGSQRFQLVEFVNSESVVNDRLRGRRRVLYVPKWTTLGCKKRDGDNLE